MSVAPQTITVIPTTTAEQLAALARVHRSAFAGSFTVDMGNRYILAMLNWFGSSPERISLVAVQDEASGKQKIVGYVLGAPLDYPKRISRDLASTAFLAIVTHPWLLGHAEFRAKLKERFKMLLGMKRKSTAPLPVLPEPCISLVAIGVDPSAQGQGVGSRLTEAFEASCRERGAKAMRLCVRHENKAARAMYMRHGWTCCPEPQDPPTGNYFAKHLD